MTKDLSLLEVRETRIPKNRKPKPGTRNAKPETRNLKPDPSRCHSVQCCQVLRSAGVGLIWMLVVRGGHNSETCRGRKNAVPQYLYSLKY